MFLARKYKKNTHAQITEADSGDSGVISDGVRGSGNAGEADILGQLSAGLQEDQTDVVLVNGRVPPLVLLEVFHLDDVAAGVG